MRESGSLEDGWRGVDTEALRRALLAWFRRHKRDLPWRSTRDPYRIWLSEVMLQQTQVATATPYYERFVQRFPDVASLAEAPLDDVLAQWAGLGYYRRARLLHAGAQAVVREHGGVVPSDPASFGALPGVGRYTVGAVLSLGFGTALPVLDGNVARVLSRWTALPLAVKRPSDAKRLWAMAEALVPGAGSVRGRHRDAGAWNEALMELGATVCTPRAPACPTCPVGQWCRANRLGRVAEFPPVPDARAPESLRRAVALLETDGRVLVTRREGALLEGLWEMPGVDLEAEEGAARPLRRALGALNLKQVRLTDTGLRVQHTITHRRIGVEVWRGTWTGRRPSTTTKLVWADASAREHALTALARKVVKGASGA